MISNNKANKRVCPTLTLVRSLGRGSPATRVLCIKADEKLRSEVIPSTKVSFGAVRVRKFGHSLSLGGLGAVCLFLGDIRSSGGVVGAFGPSIIIKANNCIYNSILCTTTEVGVPAIVRRRGDVTNIAGGFLKRFISGVYVYFSRTGSSFPRGRGVIFAKGPQTRRIIGVGGSSQLGRFNLSPSGEAILVFKNSHKTEEVGRDTLRTVGCFGKRP